jgi:hypothetical protein
MIKKFIFDKDIRVISGLVFLSFLTAYYLFNNPDTINKEVTTEIKVILSSKPEYDDNPETVNHIFFKGNGYDKEFRIYNFVNFLIFENDFLDLNINDSLKITVNKGNLIDKRKKIFNNYIEVYGIKRLNGEIIFDINDYNYTEKNSWKGLFTFGLIFLGILFLIIIYKVILRIKKNYG